MVVSDLGLEDSLKTRTTILKCGKGYETTQMTGLLYQSSVLFEFLQSSLFSCMDVSGPIKPSITYYYQYVHKYVIGIPIYIYIYIL